MKKQNRRKNKMTTWLLSIISGSFGVFISSIIQIMYLRRIEKQHLKDDYKKICVAEWIALINQTLDLLNTPKIYNHIIFNQYIEQKVALLAYIDKNDSVKSLVDYIINFKDELSLGGYAETALNIKTDEKTKSKLMRAITTLVKEVIAKINGI